MTGNAVLVIGIATASMGMVAKMIASAFQNTGVLRRSVPCTPLWPFWLRRSRLSSGPVLKMRPHRDCSLEGEDPGAKLATELIAGAFAGGSLGPAPWVERSFSVRRPISEVSGS